MGREGGIVGKYSVLWLGFFGILVSACIGLLTKTPGYLDADVYYYGGIRLVRGFGFSEGILWNYLDSPTQLPHSSHGYWYPLASVVAAAGMAIFGNTGFRAAQAGFILLSGGIGPAVYAMARQFGLQNGRALFAGVLAVLGGIFTLYYSAIDNYSPLMVAGALVMGLMARWQRQTGNTNRVGVALGVLLAWMNYARADSLLWVPLVLAGLAMAPTSVQGKHAKLRGILLAAGVWAGLMLPWWVRNILAFGSPLGAGGTQVMWLTNYNDIFAWPATRLGPAALMDQSLAQLLQVRISTLGTLAGNFALAQAGPVALFFAVHGFFRVAERKIAGWFLAGWLLLAVVLSALFPYAAGHGSFYHASAAFFPLVSVLAAAGTDLRLGGLGQRVWGILLLIIAICTIYLGAVQAIFVSNWNRDLENYTWAADKLARLGAAPGELVMASNPAAMANIGGFQAIIPANESEEVLVELANAFGVRYMVLDDEYCRQAHREICTGEKNPVFFRRIATQGSMRLFVIEPKFP